MVFIYSWADSILRLHLQLLSLGIQGEIIPGETERHASKIAVKLNDQQIMNLRHDFDVMVLERQEGSCVVYLDKKGFRFAVR